MIISKLHRLKENMASNDLLLGLTGDEEQLGNIRAHLDMLQRDVPLYYLHDEVLDMAASESARQSITALIKMGLAKRLPFPEMIVEHPVALSGYPNTTIFVLLREEGISLDMPRHGPAVSLTDGSEVSPIDTIEVSFSALFMLWKEGDVLASPLHVIDASGRHVPNLVTVPVCTIEKKEDHETLRTTSYMIKTSIKALLMALSTDGVGQQRIEAPAKLNKARASRGKAPVPAVTLLHLSHYHDSSGKRHGVSTGRHVRLHLRAGHIRNQACGLGFKDHRQVFIKPVVVNYVPNVPVPVPVREVVP